MRLDEAVWTVKVEWEDHNGTMSRGDYISLLLGQLMEAVQHAERGELLRYSREMADIVSIAYQALMAEGLDPEPFVVARVLEKILPALKDGSVEAKYRLQRRIP